MPRASTRAIDGAPARAGLRPAPVAAGVPVAVLRFAVPAETPVLACVIAPDGRIVRVVLEGKLSAGEHCCAWDGLDARGARVPAGTYTLRLEAAGHALASRTLIVG